MEQKKQRQIDELDSDIVLEYSEDQPEQTWKEAPPVSTA